LATTVQPTSAIGIKESKWPATIRNIATGGVVLQLARRFEPGTSLAVELPARGGREAFTVLARVVHIKGQEDGSWALGCQFVCDITEDDIRRLLPPATSNLEKKTIAKVHCRVEICPGTIINYLIKRMDISDEWPLPAGKIVTMRGDASKGQWGLKVQVIKCRLQREGWLLHCQLPQTPTVEDVLQALASLAPQS
jgi:hypothetical protein